MSKIISVHFLISNVFLLFCFLLNIFFGFHDHFAWLNLVLFLTLFASAIINPLFSLCILTFVLPFTSNISDQIKAIFNVEVFTLDLLSIDTSIGFLTGLFVLTLFTQNWKSRPTELQAKPRILVFLLIGFHALVILTAAIAISRNLYQAASPFSVKGLFYNLANIRSINWFDDYFPLRDILIFTTVITLSIRLITLVRTKSQLSRNVLAPLFIATLLILNYALWSKFTGIGYYRDGRTVGANSFLPDLHAFGSYALAAFVGGLYYLTSHKSIVKLAAGAFALLAASGVIVSASRFSIATLFFSLLVYVCYFLIKRPEKRLATFFFTTLSVLISAVLVSYWGDRGLFENLILVPKTKSFKELNVALSYRPEIFHSDLLMYSHYPILGVGKGDFYRQSSIREFSDSTFFTILNHGENAHNYFLQILAETGIIGLSIFCSIFIYQTLYFRSHQNQIITVLTLGVFLGNIYGHSLLVPNILILLFILLGATNTEVQDTSISVKSSSRFFSKPWRYFLIVGATILIVNALVEVETSYGKIPFQQRFTCYKQVDYNDKQTSGLFENVYKVTGKNLKLDYVVYHPDVQRRSLTIDFNLQQQDQRIANYKREVISPGHYQDNFDISRTALGSNISLQIKTSRCFTPINLGVSLDKRRLGIQLLQVSQQ